MKHYAHNRCEPSIEVIVKMVVRPAEGGLVGSKVWSKGWCGVNAKRGRLGGQGRCEPRIELIVKMHKKSGGAG